MRSEWVDCTGYSRGQERIPTSWRRDMGGGLVIVVTCSHIYYKGEWIMHCEPWFNTKQLNILENGNADEAQRAALALVVSKVDEMHKAAHAIGAVNSKAHER